jgi:hypothetical protein
MPPPLRQVSVHVTVWPQLFVVEPHASDAHAVVADSGVQHVWLLTQTSPALQSPQGIEMPHVTRSLSQTLVPQALASMVQHVPPSWQKAPPVQVPHTTSAPQLFVAVPQVWPLHVFEVGSGLQSHVLASLHMPPSHPPQSIESPQLSVVKPQRSVHHVACATGVQHVCELQTPPSPQAHITLSPQVSVSFTPHRLPHVTASAGGVQQVPPSSQTSVECSQLAVPSTPQPTIWLQLFNLTPQFEVPHVIDVE